MSVDVYCRRYDGEEKIGCEFGSGRHATFEDFDSIWFIMPKGAESTFSGYHMNDNISSVNADDIFCFIVNKYTEGADSMLEHGRNLLCFGDMDRMYEELNLIIDDYDEREYNIEKIL